ncbi:Na+/H+ antiporter subunit E [Brachybacterium sp. Z12]|uniref:Na+/H+ antiporter subunit E n=1 Tax=Brachybacterium sp. Z12 TaxID=2759167 RepID=UPI00186191FD|nr:Na+/H+ antiporter subunit E [Brachybacterium sp. Z12]QNN82424.1 Na+/H+ antiporter subunit E [Brachybacterium sp. Z12]
MNASLLTLPFRLIGFALWFAKEIVVSSLAVVRDSLTPGHASTPRVVRMELGEVSDLHVVMISILITLTPGTLTLGQLGGGTGFREILVHSMYHEDDESALADLHDMDQRMTRSITIGGRS